MRRTRQETTRSAFFSSMVERKVLSLSRMTKHETNQCSKGPLRAAFAYCKAIRTKNESGPPPPRLRPIFGLYGNGPPRRQLTLRAALALRAGAFLDHWRRPAPPDAVQGPGRRRSRCKSRPVYRGRCAPARPLRPPAAAVRAGRRQAVVAP